MARKDKPSVPTVLAFERKLVSSDGFLYGGTWGDDASYQPLSIFEKSIRGTISNRQKPSMASDPLKLNAKLSSANIQRIDACSLTAEQNSVKLVFSLKVLGGLHVPSACNNMGFLRCYEELVQQYTDEYGFKELAYRYAANIANGRALWRNRSAASQVRVVVQVAETDIKFEFDGKAISIKHFNDKHPQIEQLAGHIAKALCQKEGSVTLLVSVEALLAPGQVVYPSQELVLDDRSGTRDKKSKVLYSNGGIAALHDQKIGNALRTIDTWYKAYEDTQNPISIETYGAVTTMGAAFRVNHGENFYSLFDAWVCGDEPESDQDKHFVMAVLVRGGVFGGSDKE